MPNYFAYQRISTKKERDKQTFSRQSKSIEKYFKSHNIVPTLPIETFIEDKSGKNFEDREQFRTLEKIIQPGDTIVFKDISRFTREREKGIEKYWELFNKNINLVFLDNPTISTDYIKKLLNVAEQQNIVAKTALESTIKLLIIVEFDRVEQERLTIIQRTKDGIKASKKTQGRKKGTKDKLTETLIEDLKEYKHNRNITAKEIYTRHNISRNTFYKYLNDIE